MKVLFINSVCRSGSTGKITYDLYTQLRENGNDAAICYGRGGLLQEENIIRFANKAEVYLHALLTRATGLTGCFSPLATVRLLRFIDQYKPDVIHIHELHAYFVNLRPVMAYIKSQGIKTVWTFHCEFMYTGKCGYSYECDRWTVGCGECPHLKDYPRSLWIDYTSKMFKKKRNLFNGFDNLAIVTPSNWLADRVARSFLKDKSLQVIHNGIDIKNIFYPRESEYLRQRHRLTTEKVVLAVAPDIMMERKGGRYVLQLAAQLKTQNIKFILVGVKDILEVFPENVIALGRTEDQAELAAYYSMADVFVICSKMENFPTTCLEALSCGTPVCGFDVGGTKETAPGEIGRFVPYGDIEQLKAAIMDFLNQEHLSQKCLEYATNHYSKEYMLQKYMALYTD